MKPSEAWKINLRFVSFALSLLWLTELGPQWAPMQPNSNKQKMASHSGPNSLIELICHIFARARATTHRTEWIWLRVNFWMAAIVRGQGRRWLEWFWSNRNRWSVRPLLLWLIDDLSVLANQSKWVFEFPPLVLHLRGQLIWSDRRTWETASHNPKWAADAPVSFHSKRVNVAVQTETTNWSLTPNGTKADQRRL